MTKPLFFFLLILEMLRPHWQCTFEQPFCTASAQEVQGSNLCVVFSFHINLTAQWGRPKQNGAAHIRECGKEYLAALSMARSCDTWIAKSDESLCACVSDCGRSHPGAGAAVSGRHQRSWWRWCKNTLCSRTFTGKQNSHTHTDLSVTCSPALQLPNRASGLIALYVVGSVTMVIAILGAYGAHKESKVCLIVVSDMAAPRCDETKVNAMI